MKPGIQILVIGIILIVGLGITLLSSIDGQPACQALGVEGLALLGVIVLGVVMASASTIFSKKGKLGIVIPLAGGLLLGALFGGVPMIIYALITDPDSLHVYQIILALAVIVIFEVGVLIWIVLRNRMSI